MLREGAVSRAFHRAESSLGPEQDYAEQVWRILMAFREAIGTDVLVDPPVPSWIAPPFMVLQALFDRLWPDGTCVALFVVDEAQDRLHTSLLLEKQGGHVVRMTSHRALGGVTLGRNWREQAGRVRVRVAEVIAPVHVAVFVDLVAARALARGDESLARVIANRQAVLDPGPPWMYAVAWAGQLWKKLSRGLRLYWKGSGR